MKRDHVVLSRRQVVAGTGALIVSFCSPLVFAGTATRRAERRTPARIPGGASRKPRRLLPSSIHGFASPPTARLLYAPERPSWAKVSRRPSCK